jgi:hypothetical protein
VLLAADTRLAPRKYLSTSSSGRSIAGSTSIRASCTGGSLTKFLDFDLLLHLVEVGDVPVDVVNDAVHVVDDEVVGAVPDQTLLVAGPALVEAIDAQLKAAAEKLAQMPAPLTTGQQRLRRELRIHAKRPYGPRGLEFLLRHAVEAFASR